MPLFALLLSIILCTSQASDLFAQDDDKQTSKRPDLPLIDIFDTKTAKVEVQADSVEYLKNEDKIIAKNNALLSYGGTQITADYAEVETNTKKVFARGHVIIYQHGNARAEGDEIYYDFANKSGTFPDSRIITLPWYTRGEQIKQVREGVKVVREGGITSCNLKKPHYELRAKKITVYEGDKVVAWNVTFHILGKPVFWLPVVTMPLQNRGAPLAVSTGYNDRFGYFIHTKKGFSIIKQVWGELQADWRSKRGFGAGTQFNYDFGNFAFGDLKLYLTQDRRAPTPSAEAPYDMRQKHTRGRITWRHRTNLDEHSHLIMRYNRVADEYFYQDFFEKEFRSDVEQHSFLALTKNTDRYGSLLHLEKKMNSYESMVEKLPHIQLDWRDQPLKQPWLFYQSQLSYSNLTKTFKRTERNETVNRYDYYNEISTPIKWQDFKLTPNFNLRNTYYSRDIESSGDHWRVVPGWGADLRTQYYKTSPTTFDKWGIQINQLRHVFEPNFQYKGQFSNVSDEKLQRFDSTDRIDDANILTMGMDNRIQTKRVVRGKMRRVDIVSLNTFLSYEFHPDGRTQKTMNQLYDFDETRSAFTTWGTELTLRPYTWMQYQTRYDYDLRDDKFHIFNQDLSLKAYKFKLSFGHRLVQDVNFLNSGSSNQFVFNAQYMINSLWDVGGYVRWDPSDRGLEEWQLSATRDLHDFDFNFGYNMRDSAINGHNYTVFFDLVLKAYPSAHIHGGGNTMASFSDPRIGDTVSGTNPIDDAPVYYR